MRPLALLPLLLILAGCASPDAATTTNGPGGDASTPGDGTGGNSTSAVASAALFGPGVAMQDCVQLHSFMPTPAAIFEGVAPAGFTLATTNGGATTEVFVGWQFCDGGFSRVDGEATPKEFPDGATFLAALQVVPPTGLATDEAILDLYPLTWVEEQVLATRLLAAWQVPRVETGTIENFASTDSDVVTRRTYTAETSFGTFTAENLIQNAAAVNAANAYRVWVDANASVLGYVRIENGNSTTIGEGASALAFNGDVGSAPPVNHGMAHMVEEADVTYLFVATVATA